jgi:glycerophosphoryl diester phosphodiesterase
MRRITETGRRVAIAGGLLALLLAAAVGTDTHRRIDRSWFAEGLKDRWGAIRSDEDWLAVGPLGPGLRYDWLGPAPADIAHALGAAGTPAQNTLPAASHAVRSGLRLLEVDLWLTDDGTLRCHHGPDAPGPLRDGDCSFGALLAWAAGRDVWLVLDIKTDFGPTGERVLAEVSRTGLAGRVIFQLYQPAHLAQFARWRVRADLPGPMVTAYRSRRSLDHQATGAARAGVRAFVFPLERGQALTVRPAGMALFVHPVHDCDALDRARRWGVHGVFRVVGMECHASG